MQPLIDADILLHEIGWSGEFTDKETKESIILDPIRVFEILDEKVKYICEDVKATQPPILYLTDSEWLNNELNRRRKFIGEPEVEYKPLFRYEVAVTQPYKGNRNNPKPFHFKNLIIHMLSEYNVVVSNNGLEADDMMCIEQRRRPSETIICSRDKDLRICEGWHFSWECGSQKAIGPEFTDRIGWLNMEIKEKELPTGKIRTEKKVTGYGLSFFYYQMLVGDTADYIPGLQGWGQVKAYDLLSTLSTEEELFKAVKEAYVEKLGKDKSKSYFLEQANLLWMIQKDGEFYKIPKFM